MSKNQLRQFGHAQRRPQEVPGIDYIREAPEIDPAMGGDGQCKNRRKQRENDWKPSVRNRQQMQVYIG